MAQAKGVLPRYEDRDVLYQNPQAAGYFLGVRLDPAADRAAIEGWFRTINEAIEELVARETEGAPRAAAVAIGVSRGFFLREGFTPPIEPPAAFVPGEPLPHEGSSLAGGAQLLSADVMFNVVTASEARLAQFLDRLWATRPLVVGVTLERGYQRLEEREPFGYKDGVRNVSRGRRSHVVYVDAEERHLEEPEWAHGGTYMVFMKIAQHRDAFGTLAVDAQDAAVGRNRQGERLDRIGRGSDPRDEPSEPMPAIPPSSHVRKSGPRGGHDDTEIFRRGMPFVEVAGEGVRVGLQFCSFQASLEQLDVVLNDWMANPQFPDASAGSDALLDPARGFVAFEQVGYFFVVPAGGEYHGETLFRPPVRHRPPTEGRLAIRKRVVSDADPRLRFDRRGFRFRVLDASGQQAGTEMITDSTGRAVLDQRLTVGQTYTLEETGVPAGFPGTVQPPQQFVMDGARLVLRPVNRVPVGGTPSWGG